MVRLCFWRIWFAQKEEGDALNARLTTDSVAG